MAGGGGNAGALMQNGNPGTANTGGGGAGSAGSMYNPDKIGGNGGAGVVIIRAPRVAVSTTGSPTVTTDGSDTIYQFNGTGSITF